MRHGWPRHPPQPSYLTQSVYKVVWQKLIPTRIRQLIFNIFKSRGQVDGFVGGIYFCKTTLETLYVRSNLTCHHTKTSPVCTTAPSTLSPTPYTPGNPEPKVLNSKQL